MSSVIKNVFSILGIMLISLLLFNLVFGDIGRATMWGGIKPAIEKSWRDNTLNDGRDVYDTITNEFNSVSDLSTR